MRRNEVSGATEGYKPPHEDVDAPDVYISGTLRLPFHFHIVPRLMEWGLVMAFVTYILLSAFLSGIQGYFSRQDFSVITSYAFAVVLFEFLAINLRAISSVLVGRDRFLIFLLMEGYEFVGIIVTMLVRLVGILGRREGASKGMGRWVEWGIFIYCFLGLGFFMACVRSSLFCFLLLGKEDVHELIL